MIPMEMNNLKIALVNAIDLLIELCGYMLIKACNEIGITSDDYFEFIKVSNNETNS